MTRSKTPLADPANGETLPVETEATQPAEQTPPAAPDVREQPKAGGSYVRQPDGSLKRVEFTALPTLADDEQEG